MDRGFVLNKRTKTFVHLFFSSSKRFGNILHILGYFQLQVIVGSDCKKTYKTRGGFQRHRASKHSQQVNGKQFIPTEEILREMVHSTMLNLREKKIYSVNLRNEMDIPKFQGLKTNEFSELKYIFD